VVDLASNVLEVLWLGRRVGFGDEYVAVREYI
jgi:hypothetical protein